MQSAHKHKHKHTHYKLLNAYKKMIRTQSMPTQIYVIQLPLI